MKGVFQWVGSRKKQEHLAMNSKGREVFYYLVKHQNPDHVKKVGKIRAQIASTGRHKDGQRNTATNKQARPESSGQGSSYFFISPCLSTRV